MKVGHEVSSAGNRFIGALASTRLPDVSTRQELGEVTLDDPRIIRMLGDFAASYGWTPKAELRQLERRGPEDMLWLWCMHSLWTDASCTDLLATTCRPGYTLKTNGKRFERWLWCRGANSDSVRT